MTKPPSVIVPTRFDIRKMPVVDMTGANPSFNIRIPLERITDEISKVTIDISHTGQETSMDFHISFRMPDGNLMADDKRFAHAREYANRLFEALTNSRDPALANLD
jgi:hypothetical protein